MKRGWIAAMMAAALLGAWLPGDGLQAEVVTDGTTGGAGPVSLPGPDYDIRPEFGDIAGRNLFHSFSRFNIDTGESAVFGGPSSVENIISRVTGGGMSSIDGLLRSAIPGASLFLLNPAGILFGPGAAIDVDGAFHASTAHYLRLGEAERWHTTPAAGEYLSSAPPSAFGFLDGPAAPITIDGSDLSSLGNTVSLIGGDLDIRGGAQITIDGGRLDMAAVASPGEAVPGPDGLDASSFDAMGDIAVTGDDQGRPSGISVSAGSVFIRGGRFVVDNSEIIADAPFSAGDPAEGVVDIAADSVDLKNGALLSTDTFGRADGADIRIQARDTVDIAGSMIRVGTFGPQAEGDAGNLAVSARKIRLQAGSLIQSESRSQATGDAGDVTLSAQESATVSGTQINTFTTGTGNAGNVTIDAGAVRLEAGAEIRAFTRGSGTAGRVAIRAGESIRMTGDAAIETETEDIGPAGVIELAAAEVSLEEDAVVSSASRPSRTLSARNGGEAGTIRVTAAGGAALSGRARITTETAGTGAAGDIIVEAGRFEMDGAAFLSSSSTAAMQGGAAGTITVSADDVVQLTGGAALKTEAESGGGGRIAVNAGTGIYLLDSTVSTSVGMGEGDGGDIRIGAPAPGGPDYTILNRSSLTANADQGDGGAIFILSENYFQSADSVVEATSRRGNDGTVEIIAPRVELIGGLTPLPSDFLDAERWIRNPCAIQPAADRMSRFVFREARDGMPQGYDDWLPSGGVLYPAVLEAMGTAEAETGRTLLVRGDFAGVAEHFSDRTDESVAAAVAAHALMALGHYRSALSSLYDARPAAEASDDAARKALFYNALGDLYLCLGNTRGAIEYQKRAVDAAASAESPLLAAGAFNQLGNVRASAGNLDGALAAYELGLARLAAAGDAGGMAAVLLTNQARVRMAEGRWPEASALTDRAGGLLEAQADAYAVAAGWLCLGMLREEIAEASGARSGGNGAAAAYAQALEIGERIQNQRVVSAAMGGMGRLDEASGRHAAALEKTRTAIAAAETGYHPEILFLWHWQMGRISEAMGDRSAAIFWLRSAIDVLNPIRWEYFNGRRDRKKRFDDHVKPVYIDVVELLLEDDARLEEAWETMERLKAVELQDFFQDACVGLRAAPEADPADGIPEKTALLYPIPLEHSLVLLLRFADGIEQIRVPVTADRVGDVARRFRESVQEYDEAFLGDAVQLYDWLIRPADPELARRGIDTLVVVPDGPLRLVPFAALNDGSRYLIERYAVGVVPALRLTDTGAASPEGLRGRTVLLNGLSEETRGFAPLDHVPAELNVIQRMLGGEILLNEAFTSAALKRALETKPYDIVHMATHAVFRDSAEGSFLLTYDGRLTMDQLDALIRFGRDQGRPLDLLTLSACDTAVGDERAAFGLAGVALKAGAKSALASLWETDDEAAKLVVEAFYRHLVAPGATKASALQQAQMELLGNPHYGHPGAWAAFLIVGSWR